MLHFSFEFGAGLPTRASPTRLASCISLLSLADFLLLRVEEEGGGLHFSFEFGWYGCFVEPFLTMPWLLYLSVSLLLGNAPALLSVPCWCLRSCVPGVFSWIRMGLKRCSHGWFQFRA